MKKGLFRLLLISVVLLFSSYNASGVSSDYMYADSCDKPQLQLSITQGYYADVDADGYEDDVYIETTFRILCTNRANFDYYIELILPSGTTFTYGYRVTTRLNTLTFHNDFFDHALESGDYTVNVYVIMKTGGTALVHDQLIFDPPGGSNSDPKFSLSWS